MLVFLLNFKMTQTNLVSRKQVEVRFSEVDTMRIVWHGHYVKYMEDGREDFGRKFGIGYMDILEHGFMVPVIELKLNYKKPLYYGDKAIVETRFIDDDAAKIIYRFNIYREKDMELIATGESIQVFTDLNGELILTIPEFFGEWKREHLEKK